MAAQASPTMDSEESINTYLPALLNESVPTDGAVRVASAGTPVSLGASLAIRSVVVTAHASNSGAVIVAGSGVNASIASRAGAPVLAPGDTASWDIDTPSRLFVDAENVGGRISFTFLR